MDRSSTLLFLDRPVPGREPVFRVFDEFDVADGAWDRARLESYVEGHPW